MKIELSREEKLVLENLRLKIQMAELQKQQTQQQLLAYTRELMSKYGLPPGSTVQLTEAGVDIQAPPLSLSSTPEPAEEPSEKVLSQAEAMAQNKNGRAA